MQEMLGTDGGGYGEKRMHCFFLLDSTGSMSSLRTSVVTGFNSFLLTQQKQPGSMLMTLARFNSFAPFDLRFDARDVHQVAPLDRSGFEPSNSARCSSTSSPRACRRAPSTTFSMSSSTKP